MPAGRYPFLRTKSQSNGSDEKSHKKDQLRLRAINYQNGTLNFSLKNLLKQKSTVEENMEISF